MDQPQQAASSSRMVIGELGADNDKNHPSPSEHYKLLIEDARALGDRRETINNLFVGLLSLLAGGLGYVLISFPGKLIGLLVTLVASVVGIYLSKVWADVLGNYRALLKLRFALLRKWESFYQFPQIQSYYNIEELLYDRNFNLPSELDDSTFQSLRGNASYFVDEYTALPRLMVIAFLLFILVQVLIVLSTKGILPSTVPSLLSAR